MVVMAGKRGHGAANQGWRRSGRGPLKHRHNNGRDRWSAELTTIIANLLVVEHASDATSRAIHPLKPPSPVVLSRAGFHCPRILRGAPLPPPRATAAHSMGICSSCLGLGRRPSNSEVSALLPQSP